MNTRDKGDQLNSEWAIGARQVRYRETGDWYHLLEHFPAAYADEHGYKRWHTEEDYRADPDLRFGPDPNSVHFQAGRSLSNIDGYIRMVARESE